MSNAISRRSFVEGIGAIALAQLCAQSRVSANTDGDRQGAPHFRPRARRVIFLYMAGGPSQIDTFDYKPVLQRMHGKSYGRTVEGLIDKFAKNNGVLFGSPFRFRRYGSCGQWVSELFPHVARHVDDLCFLKGVHTEGFDHGQAGLFFMTGASNFVRPSLGSWVSYGLGTENENLPSFIHLGPSPDYGGSRLHSNAFLPARHQGLAIGSSSLPVRQWRVRNLTNPEMSRALQREQLTLLNELNGEHAERSAERGKIAGLTRSFETAFRMQIEASTLFELENETAHTCGAYGLNDPVTEDFGRQCLLARRMSEAGVRFVMVTHSVRKRHAAMREWDQHQDLEDGHRKNARQVDRPIAALLADLKQRGLLEDTLVIWAGEFGRAPMIEMKPGQPNVISRSSGRDHNPLGFTLWLAGGGTKAGFSYGATDEIGYRAVEGRVHTHDLHATILHLLGIDHERLTFRTAGRDFRLTDIAGRVVGDVLA